MLYTVTFPASTSGRDVIQQFPIHMIDDNTTETVEGFYLFIMNYTSLYLRNLTEISDDVVVENKVALVQILDDDDGSTQNVNFGMIVSAVA